MAMKQITKTCPHCSKVYEQRTFGAWGKKTTDEDRWMFGSPLKICPNCGKLFLDNDYQEIAITGPRPSDKDIVTASTRMLLGLALILGTLMYLCGQIVFAAIVIGVAVAYLILDVTMYPGRMKKLEKEKLASEKRLSDPGYARALKRAGYNIPEEYLKENAEPDSAAAEQ